MRRKCHVISDDCFFNSGFRNSINSSLNYSIKINVEFYNANLMSKKFNFFPGDLVIIIIKNVHLRHFYLSQFNLTYCRLLILHDMPFLKANLKNLSSIKSFPWLLPKNISINMLFNVIHKSMRTYVFYDEAVNRAMNIFSQLSKGRTIHEISNEFKVCTPDLYKIRRSLFLKYGLEKCNTPNGIFLIRDILKIRSIFI